MNRKSRKQRGVEVSILILIIIIVIITRQSKRANNREKRKCLPWVLLGSTLHMIPLIFPFRLLFNQIYHSQSIYQGCLAQVPAVFIGDGDFAAVAFLTAVTKLLCCESIEVATSQVAFVSWYYCIFVDMSSGWLYLPFGR